ncbi:hypothetical protein PU345_002123 [Enterobacter kobei]|nr:hypothetical protein [Enterobacter kobei]
MNTITREFTKEQLIEAAQLRIAVAKHFPDVVFARQDKALSEIALKSMAAEPVYQCEFCHPDGNGELQWHWEDVNKDFYDQYDAGRRGKRRILYTTPPALDITDNDKMLTDKQMSPQQEVKKCT